MDDVGDWWPGIPNMGALAFCAGLRSFVYPTGMTEGKSTKNRDVSFFNEAAARSALQRVCSDVCNTGVTEKSGSPIC